MSVRRYNLYDMYDTVVNLKRAMRERNELYNEL